MGKETGRVKGKVAALVGPAEVAVKEFEVPEPEPGAVLAKIRRANVCGSEVHIYHFRHPLIRECVLGHEFVGEVLALGEGVTTDYAGNPVEVGDRVIAPYFLTCRRCPACLRGDFNLCQKAYTFWSRPPEDDPHFHGAFATHYYVHPEQYFYKVPDGIPDNTVAGANCGLAQVLFGLHQTGLSTGDSLLIQGAGGLGLYAAAIGRDMGARVMVVEGIRQRIDLARRFGAEEIVNMKEYPEAGDRVRQVHSLTDGYGADVVLEVAGVPAAFVEALQLVRPGGRVIEIGNVSVGKEHEVSLAPGLITRKMIRVQGFVRYQPWYLHRALGFLERKHDDHPFDELTDEEYTLKDVGRAIERAEAKKVARPAVVPA
jgi:L-iditol 2-dehydrogenase